MSDVGTLAAALPACGVPRPLGPLAHNKRNWGGPGPQGYALAVAFERDLDHPALYADLQAFVEAQAALEAELPMEVVLQG